MKNTCRWLLVLLFAGCAQSPDRGGVGVNEAAAAMKAPPAANPRAALDGIERGVWPGLATVVGSPADQKTVAGLKTGDWSAWLTPFAGPEVEGLRVAAVGVHRATGAYPTNLGELAPYCFTWPASGPHSSQPLPLMSPAALKARSCTLQELSAHGEAMSVDLSAQSVTINQPVQIAGKLAIQPQSLGYGFDPGTYVSVQQGRTDAAGLAKGPWSSPALAKITTTDPADLRYFAAAEAIELMIEDAASHFNEFPTSPEEIERAAGGRFINLVPVTTAQAEIEIGWDGVQAYRILVHLPSGKPADTVKYFTSLGPMCGSAVVYSYSEFATHVKRPMRTIAAFNLVPIAEATLPGLAATPAPTGPRPKSATVGGE